MRIEILAVDRLRSAWAREAMRFYCDRIGHYARITRKTVKPSKRTGAAAVEEESARILKQLEAVPRRASVLMTPVGRALPSAGWAAMFQDWMNTGLHTAVFIVGGADGVSSEVEAAVDHRVSLGPQTLAHELAQIVLAEQIYRAWSIVRGEPYHR